ncbi:hypothetical protein POM88_045992 [Heracleum sosnowskyi]|uniref:Uncharacterized protein n=1 Tax=Heracleum sosnowskyi TaxID=360622 RepID=A0AAD8M6Z3_9APIA|nr:hypothetical protein POM88_045992 [Heracleum sosnowskyi]
MWRRSLGKSMRGVILERLNPLSRYNYNYIVSSTIPLCYYHGFTRSINSSSNFFSPPGNHYEDYESKCELEVQARVGSDSNLPLVTINATRSWKELKKQNIKYQKVTKGDVIDLREFLFTEYRDYLIRYNDNTKVKAEQLAGKVILLYFVSLSHHAWAILQPWKLKAPLLITPDKPAVLRWLTYGLKKVCYVVAPSWDVLSRKFDD